MAITPAPEPPSGAPPEVSAVVCTFNGADRLSPVLEALDRQTVRDRMEIIVVDDGSTDDTARVVGGRPGVRLVRHRRNLGIGAARDTAIREATAPWVAFTDDDCEPAPDWAEQLLAAATRWPDAVVLGAAIVPTPAPGLVQRYLREHNPLAPLEAALIDDLGPMDRLIQYLRRGAGVGPTGAGERRVASVASAGVLMRRDVVLAAGGFDGRFRFGGEEEDLQRRLAAAGRCIAFIPGAVVQHRFVGTVRDTLRRARGYGRGNARAYLKDPGSTPTIYPAPLLVAGAGALGVVWWPALVVAALLPQAAFSRWPRRALRLRDPELLVFPYLQLAQEAANDLGWVDVWRHERAAFAGVVAEEDPVSVPGTGPSGGQAG